MIPGDFALYSRRIGGATGLAEMGARALCDTARREVVVKCVDELCQSDYEGSAKGVGGRFEKEQERKTAGARN